MHRNRWAMAGWAAVAWLLAADAGAERVMGVHPFRPATQLVEAFKPLTAYLGERMGEAVTLRVAPDYQAHTDAVGRDEVDFAYIGPAPYIALVERYGPMPLLARQAIGGQPFFHGKIFVRADSPIRRLADLRGKRFAFGESQSTMGHFVPRYMLWQAGITVEQLGAHRYLGDHVNVALGVLAGDYDAGAVKEDVYHSYEPRGLRAIATSEPISDHLFVASRRLPADRARELSAILLRLHEDPGGLAALQSMTPGVQRLVPARDSDYDSLRKVLAKMKELGVPQR